MTSEQKITVTALRQQGYGYLKIANHLGITVGSVKSFCQRNGLREVTVDADAPQSDLAAAECFCKRCGVPITQTSQKVWHSTDKYRRVIWRCNQKYEKGDKKCSTPHLTEEQVKKLFVKALNELIMRRDGIISGYDEVLKTALSTEMQEKRVRVIETEMAELEAQNEELIEKNATVALDQDEYREQRDAIVAWYENLSAEYNQLMQEINDKSLRCDAISRFRHEFEQLEPAEEFNEMQWISMLEQVTVYSKERIVFEFRDGSEITLSTNSLSTTAL